MRWTVSIRARAIAGLAAARSNMAASRRCTRPAALGAKKSITPPLPQVSTIARQPATPSFHCSCMCGGVSDRGAPANEP